MVSGLLHSYIVALTSHTDEQGIRTTDNEWDIIAWEVSDPNLKV